MSSNCNTSDLDEDDIFSIQSLEIPNSCGSVRTILTSDLEEADAETPSATTASLISHSPNTPTSEVTNASRSSNGTSPQMKMIMIRTWGATQLITRVAKKKATVRFRAYTVLYYPFTAML